MATVVSDKRGCKKALTLLLVVEKIGPPPHKRLSPFTLCHLILSHPFVRDSSDKNEIDKRTVFALEFYSKHSLSSYGLSKC